MGFYKNTIIGFAVLLFLLLSVMVYIITSKNNIQEFPSTLSICPDFYSLNESGTCSTHVNVYASKDPNCTRMKPSGLSMDEKRVWASDCGVAWDGITNSSSI